MIKIKIKKYVTKRQLHDYNVIKVQKRFRPKNVSLRKTIFANKNFRKVYYFFPLSILFVLHKNESRCKGKICWLLLLMLFI